MTFSVLSGCGPMYFRLRLALCRYKGFCGRLVLSTRLDDSPPWLRLGRSAMSAPPEFESLRSLGSFVRGVSCHGVCLSRLHGLLGLRRGHGHCFLLLDFLPSFLQFRLLGFLLGPNQGSAGEKKNTYTVFGRTLNSALRDKVVPSAFGCASVADLSSTIRMSSSGLNSIASSCMRLKRPR